MQPNIMQVLDEERPILTEKSPSLSHQQPLKRKHLLSTALKSQASQQLLLDEDRPILTEQSQPLSPQQPLKRQHLLSTALAQASW